jgi:hypothetical protein
VIVIITPLGGPRSDERAKPSDDQLYEIIAKTGTEC